MIVFSRKKQIVTNFVRIFIGFVLRWLVGHKTFGSNLICKTSPPHRKRHYTPSIRISNVIFL